jgi:hypothetical protein
MADKPLFTLRTLEPQLLRKRGKHWQSFHVARVDLLVVQIDGLHLGDDLVLVAAIGVDGEGNKHPLALVEGATENAATVQALLTTFLLRH